MTPLLAILLSIILPLAAAYLLNQWYRRDLAEDERVSRTRRRMERRIAQLAPLDRGRRPR